MAPIPPTNPPGNVVAGDSLSWTRAFSDYPASDGWVLAYTLISSTKVFNITATADGDGFAVNVDASATEAWEPDTYRLVEYVTQGTQRVTLGTTTLVVAPNLAAASAGADTRTHAEKMLALIDAWLESRAPVAGSTEINGRKIQYYPITDLLVMRDRFAREVAREQAAPGKTAGVRILVRL